MADENVIWNFLYCQSPNSPQTNHFNNDLSFKEMDDSLLLENLKDGFIQLKEMSLKIAVDKVFQLSQNLKISMDMLEWTFIDAQKWINFIFLEYDFIFSQYIDGNILYNMDIQKLNLIFGHFLGDVINSEIEIWKSGFAHIKNIQIDFHTLTDINDNKSVSEESGIFSTTDDIDKSPSSGDISNQGYIQCTTTNIELKNTTTHTAEKNYDRKLITEILGFPHDYFDLEKKKNNKREKKRRPFKARTPQNTHLWYFLKELLDRVELYGNYVKWIDRETATFRIYNSYEVARLWGIRKGRPAMNYDKLSRSLRQYYKKGIMKKARKSQRLIYQFVGKYAL